MDLTTERRPVTPPQVGGQSPPEAATGSVASTNGSTAPTAGETTPPGSGTPPSEKQSPDSPSAQPAALPAKAAATGAIPRGLPPVGGPKGPDDVIFVTGFGPFGQHVVNASWQAVSRLHELGLEEELDARLVIEEVPVEYEYVMREIPKRWRELRPRLTVHVGVSAHTMTLQLERRAHNGPYRREDVLQRMPPGQCCVSGRPGSLCTRLDLARTCKAVARGCSPMDASVSDDAGHYLCDFIYFTSLSQDAGRTVFVHVPPLDMPYSANQMAAALAEAIRDLYGQVLAVDQPPPKAMDLSCPHQQSP